MLTGAISPNSPKTTKESKNKIGVAITDAPFISTATNIAVEYGRTVFSRQLKTKNKIKKHKYFITIR